MFRKVGRKGKSSMELYLAFIVRQHSWQKYSETIVSFSTRSKCHVSCSIMCTMLYLLLDLRGLNSASMLNCIFKKMNQIKYAYRKALNIQLTQMPYMISGAAAIAKNQLFFGFHSLLICPLKNIEYSHTFTIISSQPSNQFRIEPVLFIHSLYNYK